VVSIQYPSNEDTQKFTTSLPEVTEPTKPWQQTSDTSLSNRTTVIFEIKPKMRENASTPAVYRGNMRSARTPVQPSREAHGTTAGDRRSRKDSKGRAPARRPRRSRPAALERGKMDNGSARYNTREMKAGLKTKPCYTCCTNLQRQGVEGYLCKR
jgi:hypothetical protein